jgi:hypothetical protein
MKRLVVLMLKVIALKHKLGVRGGALRDHGNNFLVRSVNVNDQDGFFRSVDAVVALYPGVVGADANARRSTLAALLRPDLQAGRLIFEPKIGGHVFEAKTGYDNENIPASRGDMHSTASDLKLKDTASYLFCAIYKHNKARFAPATVVAGHAPRTRGQALQASRRARQEAENAGAGGDARRSSTAGNRSRLIGANGAGASRKVARGPAGRPLIGAGGSGRSARTRHSTGGAGSGSGSGSGGGRRTRDSSRRATTGGMRHRIQPPREPGGYQTQEQRITDAAERRREARKKAAMDKLEARTTRRISIGMRPGGIYDL